jgi:hypothetical protein
MTPPGRRRVATINLVQQPGSQGPVGPCPPLLPSRSKPTTRVAHQHGRTTGRCPCTAHLLGRGGGSGAEACSAWCKEAHRVRVQTTRSKPESDFSAEDLRARLALDPRVRVHGRVRSGLDPGVRVQGRVRLAADPGVRVQGRVRLAADPGVRVHGRVRSGLDPGVPSPRKSPIWQAIYLD